MESIKPYSEQAVHELQHIVRSQHQQGKTPDYEIRLDQVIVVPRNAEMNRFLHFKSHLKTHHLELEYRVYKGDARVYDSYKFALPTKVEKDRVEQEIQKAVDLVHREYRIESLENENLRLRKKKKKLKVEIVELKQELKESKSSLFTAANAEMAFGALGNLMGNKENKNPDSGEKSENGLDGISDKELLNLLSQFKKKLEPNEFQAILGIAFTLADNRSLINKTSQFVKQAMESS